MDQVVCVHAEDFDATVEPGITRKGFNNYLRDLGLWFPVGEHMKASVMALYKCREVHQHQRALTMFTFIHQ